MGDSFHVAHLVAVHKIPDRPRAGASIPLNIAEAEYGQGRRKQASFSVALGSARESRACLDVGVALGYLQAGDDALRDDLDHVIAMLYRLSR